MREETFHDPEMTARDVCISSVVALSDEEFVVGCKPFTGTFLDGRVIDIREATFAYGVFPETDPMFDKTPRAVALMEQWRREGAFLTLTTSGESTVWSDGHEVLVLPRRRSDRA